MEEIRYAGIERYWEEISALERDLIESQTGKLGELAKVMANSVAHDGRIFTFGTGHSHMLVEESFYRAGGLAAVVPMFVPAILMLHESARMSAQMERMPELATALLDEYEPQPGDVLLIYADSGVNALPVQLAIEAREQGVIVAGICNFKYTRIAPLSQVGERLYDVVDYAIDNHGVPGDALIKLQQSDWRVAASSTIACALIWNCLLTEMAFELEANGVDVPVFASFNMQGAGEHNESLLKKWSRLNPHLPNRNIKKR